MQEAEIANAAVIFGAFPMGFSLLLEGQSRDFRLLVRYFKHFLSRKARLCLVGNIRGLGVFIVGHGKFL